MRHVAVVGYKAGEIDGSTDANADYVSGLVRLWGIVIASLSGCRCRFPLPGCCAVSSREFAVTPPV